MFARRHSLSIQARLTMLALVTALPLVVLAGFAMIRTVDDERAQAERDVRERVEDLLADVDSQISAIQAELQVLALSPSLQAGDLAAFDRQMREALTIRGTSIVLHDTNAQQLVSTNRPFGEPLPRASNNPMLGRVVETGKPQISDLIMGSVLRRPILTVGVPVFRDREIVYVLAMGLGPEILSALLQEENLSPDWTAAIFDRKGIIVARNRELDRFLGKPAAPILLEAMAGAVESWFPNVTSEEIPVYSTFRRSPITGWTVAIGLPREFVDDIPALAGLAAKALPKKLSHVGFVVHNQDADAHDAASAVAKCVRGRRIVNSVNSSARLSTSMVPPCCWVTIAPLSSAGQRGPSARWMTSFRSAGR